MVRFVDSSAGAIQPLSNQEFGVATSDAISQLAPPSTSKHDAMMNAGSWFDARIDIRLTDPPQGLSVDAHATAVLSHLCSNESAQR